MEVPVFGGAYIVDLVITKLPSGYPCAIAVECDGTPHYRMTKENSPACDGSNMETRFQLDGITHLRNTLLQPEFPDGFKTVPYFEWQKARAKKQQYLLNLLASTPAYQVSERDILLSCG
jgi:hypothetical protein